MLFHLNTLLSFTTYYHYHVVDYMYSKKRVSSQIKNLYLSLTLAACRVFVSWNASGWKGVSQMLQYVSVRKKKCKK